MVVQYGDPRVREWMKLHPEQTADIKRRRAELSRFSLPQLVKLAVLKSVDVEKLRSMLVAEIIAAERHGVQLEFEKTSSSRTGG